MTLREIPSQFAWDPVLRKFRGDQFKKKTPFRRREGNIIKGEKEQLEKSNILRGK